MAEEAGDHVDKYEPIVEVITDKVNAEVPSPFEGTLTEILVQEGETVPNNTEIAVIEGVRRGSRSSRPPTRTSGSAPAAAAPAATPEAAAGPYGTGNGPAGSDESPEPRQSPTSAARSVEQPTDPARHRPRQRRPSPHRRRVGGNGASGPDGYKGPTTPAVRRLAREHGVDLALIAGSGHSGRVTREDVLKFVESGGAKLRRHQPRRRPPGAIAGPRTAAPAQSAASAPSAPSPVAQGDSLKQPSPMRKAIAAQMTKALQVPVAYTVIEIDMSGVVALRDSRKGAATRRRRASA